MSEILSSFEKLLGRQTTDAEIHRLYRVRDALDIRSNDGFWLVLIALEHYQVLYEKIPEQVRAASQASLANIQQSSKTAMNAAAEAAKADIAEAVAKAAADVADATAKRKMFAWGLGSLAVAIGLIGIMGFTIYSQARNAGFQAGLAAGYEEAKDEKAAAAWANTPEGRAAYRLAQNGGLSLVINCTGTSWRIENGNCVPDVFLNDRGVESVTGWRLP